MSEDLHPAIKLFIVVVILIVIVMGAYFILVLGGRLPSPINPQNVTEPHMHP
jgi:hypothetical protein